MLTSKFLKGIMTEAYPVIKRQVEDAKIVSGFRDTVAANGGDWSALKALIKAHVEDTLDEEGGNKRVQKILDKADSSNAYAGMLGLIMNEKNFIADDDEVDPSTGEIKEPQPPKAAGQAGQTVMAVTSSVENEAAEISTPITEPTQASNDAGSGQAAASIPPEAAAETTPAAVEGQRSTPVTDVGGSGEAIQPETATSGEGAAAPATGESPVIESAGDTGAQPAGGENEEVAEALSDTDTAAAGSGLDNDCTVTGDGSSVPASISDVESVAPKYAAPGVVTIEHTPPEPVKWHPYATCFPTVLGDDLKALERDIHTAFGGVRDPIVKIGNLILDGRARYGIARSLMIDYPVVQYAGSDPLMDVIRWNLASRFDRMTSGQIAATAKALCKIEPDRADDIMQAFGIETAEAAE